MLRAGTHAAAGAWPAEAAKGSIELDFEGRHRRRIRLATDTGVDVLLDLERATAMADGDGVQADDGQWFRISAKPEPLLAVTAPDAHGLLKLAWHLGNRHTPAEIQQGRILIRRDHVLADMARGLGGAVAEVVEPFQPEGGAYGGHGNAPAHNHGHGGHSHIHDHDHDHAHPHDHRHD